MVTYEKARLKVAEIFFDEEEAATPADIVRYQFRPAPISGCRSTDFHTLWLDLNADREELFGKMNRGTRYEIRRAEKEELRYESSARPDGAWLEQFFAFYDRFAAGKHLAPANRARVGALASHGALDLSRMRGADGSVLVWHSYIRTQNRLRLLHSASLFREADKQAAAAAGRANRLLHWADIQRFHDEGIAVYDFGGWYVGEEDTDKLKINQFKLSFGGEVVHLYNADRPNTWKGAAALRIREAVRTLTGKEA